MSLNITLNFFGISLPVVQVGGGLVVISTGWALLRQPNDGEPGNKDGRPECNEANYSRQAFYPLTLPLTVGPGSISVAIAVAPIGPKVRNRGGRSSEGCCSARF